MEKFNSMMNRIHSPEIEVTRDKPKKSAGDANRPQEINSTMLSTGGGFNEEPKKPVFELTTLDNKDISGSRKATAEKPSSSSKPKTG